ncbi:MAG: Gfo/Idh/MocA family oxidoreductase [Treponema sp.]|jgi:predicted dehydrogenase|nr:Gfo/Idh/MocA family oxidoreductase [Treponema sp.]
MIEQSADVKVSSKLRYGMIGGGQGSFIGDVHRKALGLDGLAELCAGCFGRAHENTLATGVALGLSEDRCYKTFEEMAEKEAVRSDKIDFVVIVTPNTNHFTSAKAFLSKGIHVVCEKPVTATVEQAEELHAIAKKNKLLFGITYAYTGYPAAKQIREMIKNGAIGKIRFVNAEYPQEWLAVPAEKEGSKQAICRTDPALAGISNCVGDIGSHAENMVSYLTGLKIKSLCARLDKFGEDRVLDDNASIMLEYEGGAKGLYWSSQIAVGYDNALKVRIFGTTGTIQFAPENPNNFEVFKLGQPNEQWSRGRDPFSPHAQSYSRLPSGHPEGLFEAFANIYKTFIGALNNVKAGEALTEADMDFPGLDMGIDGVRFIHKCVESSHKGAVWVDM